MADLIKDLKGILMACAEKFQTEDFKRHLSIAAFDLARMRPRTISQTLTLVADQACYPAPADLLRPKYSSWGVKQRRQMKPWDAQFPSVLPTMTLAEQDGVNCIFLDPVPSIEQIVAFGSTYQYFYLARHVLDEDQSKTTIALADKPLLLIRATSEALQELAVNNYTKPISLGGSAGVGSMPKNGTAASLATQTMELFEKMAA